MPTAEGYNGTYTGQQIDAAIGAVANKQDKLTGTQGQVVGFDASGKAIAQDAPSGAFETVTVILDQIQNAIIVYESIDGLQIDEHNSASDISIEVKKGSYVIIKPTINPDNSGSSVTYDGEGAMFISAPGSTSGAKGCVLFVWDSINVSVFFNSSGGGIS